MLKRAAAMLLGCASMATLVSCNNNTSNRYLYAALPSPNEIVVYREDPNSGVLTTLSISPITAGQGVHSIAIHPSNKFMYAVNSFEDDVSLYALSASGALTEITPRAQTSTTPILLVMDSAGQFLYVSNIGSNPNSISAFSIDSSSGQLTAVGNPVAIGTRALNMAVAPSGNFLYIAMGVGIAGSSGSIEIWSLNAGVLNLVDVVPTGTDPNGIAIAPNGNFLYAANSGDNSISEFTIGTNGDLTLLATVGAGQGVLSSPSALLIDSAGKYLYVANQVASTVVAYSIASDGSLALLPSSYSIATNNTPFFLAFDASQKYLFVANNVNPTVQSFSRDTNTGILTSVASYNLGGNAATSIALSP